MNYSYIMGVNNIEILKQNDFEVEVFGSDYGVIFDDNKTEIFEKYICETLKKGFWNEYLGSEKVFIFKFKDGKIKKYIFNNNNEKEILKLCCEFANCQFESINKMLENNKFYAKTYYLQNGIELWEVLDEVGIPTGEILRKYDKKFFENGLYHRGADVWIINNNNEILIQKRSETKRLEPNVWAMTGGSVIIGENSLETIVREAKEELSIDIDKSKLKLVTTFKTGTVFIDTYILKCNYDISKMSLQKEEVSDVKWVTWDEISKLVNNGMFIKNRWKFVNQILKKEIGI